MVCPFTFPKPAVCYQPEAGELLVCDGSLPDLETLLQGLTPGVAVVLLHPKQSLVKLTRAVIRTDNLRKLHLLGHGSPGTLQLGRTLITGRLLNRLPRISDRNEDLTIFLWSCSTGAGQSGRNFIQALANWSGARVYGAEGAIGHESQGGSWDLNVRTDPSPPLDRPPPGVGRRQRRGRTDFAPQLAVPPPTRAPNTASEHWARAGRIRC